MRSVEPLSVVQARALARRAFVTLWQSGAMTPTTACLWLRKHFDGVESVDSLTIDECEQLARRVADFWAERNASRCPSCRVPVRQAHGHVLVDGVLFHLRCVPPREAVA
ncbi:MAG TPA: hypothetical protein VJP45_10365 [Candidatus Limnocylindria bacterium]|nr:hypothetical protein [Candidatus Limnocylindria bacterium]